MRKTRKINIGFLIFLILLAAVIIYLVVSGIYQSTQTGKLETLCTEIVDRLEPIITSPAYKEHESDLAPYCASSNTVSGTIRYIREQQESAGLYLTCFGDAVFRDFQYQFKDNTVTVWADAQVSFRLLYPDGTEGVMQSFTPTFTFDFVRENNQWKLAALDVDVASCLNGGIYSYDR